MFWFYLAIILTSLSVVIFSEVRRKFRHKAVMKLISNKRELLEYAEEQEEFAKTKIFKTISKGTEEVLAQREEFNLSYLEDNMPEELDPDTLEEELDQLKREMNEHEGEKPGEFFAKFITATVILLALNSITVTLFTIFAVLVALIIPKVKKLKRVKKLGRTVAIPFRYFKLTRDVKDFTLLKVWR